MSLLKPSPFGRSPLFMIIAYIMLVLSLVFVDQTTKLHAEKSFLDWFSPNEVHQITSDRHKVLALGVSPATAYEGNLASDKTTGNWLDFNLTYVRNTGAAWGTLGNLPAAVRTPFFFAVTFVALGVVGWLFRSSHPGQRFYRMGLCFILAGALGNFVDRIVLGYVIDWLHFHWKVFGWEYSFPVFNVADVSINVGVASILIDMLLSESAMRKIATPSPQAG